MLNRLWPWLSRLWRRPEPEPPPPDPDVMLMLEQGRRELRAWAANKMRNDIIASLQDELPIIAQNYPPQEGR